MPFDMKDFPWWDKKLEPTDPPSGSIEPKPADPPFTDPGPFIEPLDGWRWTLTRDKPMIIPVREGDEIILQRDDLKFQLNKEKSDEHREVIDVVKR